MKAFRYITALGLGAVVSLDAAVAPPQAQAEPATAEMGAWVATNLVPELNVDLERSARAIAPEATTQQLNAVALSITGLVNTPAAQTPPQPTPASSPASASASSSASSPARSIKLAQASDDVPVETETPDPIEQEFLDEPEVPPVQPPESLGEEVIEQPGAEVQSDDMVNDAPPGDSLIDSQPSLLRPTDTETVELDATLDISLERAIEIARQNSPTIRIRQLQVDQAEARVREARAALSPQVTANGGLQQSGSGTRSTEVYEEPNNPGDGDSTTTRSHTTSLSGNVRLEYGIITPGRRASIRAAETQVEQAQLQLNQDLSQLRLDVSSDYYSVQEADEQVNISQSAVESAAQSLQDAQALERAGVGTQFAVLQAEVQLANEEQNRINALSNQQRTRRILARRLSVPENFGVSSGDVVQAQAIWQPSLEESIILAYTNRVELDNQLLNREISDAQREIALAANRPSVGLFAQLGPTFNFNDTRTDIRDVVDQFGNRNDFDTRSGTRSGALDYQIGLSVSWRFLDGGAAKASARQRELDKAIAEEQFQNTRDTVRQEVEDAFYQLQANFENITTAKKGVQQAASALRLARLRFQAGVGTQSEVVDAERDLTTARGNEVSAILNYNRALVQMRRAVGETLVPPPYESPEYVEASNES